MFLNFPKKFLWGAATSSYQVEGNNMNDWTEWENQTFLKRLNKARKKKWPKYILKEYPSPLDKENYISGKTADHYNFFKEDFNIAKFLGHNAHRFSIEWSRIEPEEGKFNQYELEHYKKVVSYLKEKGIEPFVTLWHFTSPRWFSQNGGFASERAPEYFLRYSEKVVSVLGDDVKFWITLNEPIVYLANSYFTGTWPPGKIDILSGIKVFKNFVKIHKLLFKKIKELSPNSQVGIAKNMVYYSAYNNLWLNKMIKNIADYYWNFFFINKIKNCQDFIGLNYYFFQVLDLFLRNREDVKVSDLGWKIYPKGIFNLLLELKDYKKPIYITENGIADVRDSLRADFIKNHIYWIWQAIDRGVDVRGYFYWSLIDNFEWDKGFWPRFGLVGINYKTFEREIRASALDYAKICKDNGFDV